MTPASLSTMGISAASSRSKGIGIPRDGPAPRQFHISDHEHPEQTVGNLDLGVVVGVIHRHCRPLSHELMVKTSPGSMSGWVSGATPSMALGSPTPWKWTSVPMGRSLVTLTRTRSPTSTRIIGPGTIPL